MQYAVCSHRAEVSASRAEAVRRDCVVLRAGTDGSRGQPDHAPQNPRRGHHVFCPPPKKKFPKKLFFFFRKWIWVHQKKNSGLNPWSFQFWGTIGWDSVPSLPPPPLKPAAGSASAGRTCMLGAVRDAGFCCVVYLLLCVSGFIRSQLSWGQLLLVWQQQVVLSCSTSVMLYSGLVFLSSFTLSLSATGYN